MKALRLPSRVSAVAYLFRFRPHGLPPRFVSRLGAPGRSEVSPRPGLLVTRCPTSPAHDVTWTQLGSLKSPGDPSCASAPFQDPGRTDVSSPVTVTSMLPPLSGRRRLRRHRISGLALG